MSFFFSILFTKIIIRKRQLELSLIVRKIEIECCVDGGAMRGSELAEAEFGYCEQG